VPIYILIELHDFQVDFTGQKDLIKLSGKRDGCKQLDDVKSSSEIQMALEILGLPKSCPVSKVCCRIVLIDIVSRDSWRRSG